MCDGIYGGLYTGGSKTEQFSGAGAFLLNENGKVHFPLGQNAIFFLTEVYIRS